MEELKESYRRAAYADYPSEGTMLVKNAFSTTSRLLTKRLFAKEEPMKNTGMLAQFAGLITSSLAIETIFYLPNHFRQTVLVNSNNISFAKSDVALLDLMNYMFKLNNRSKPVSEFRISFFLSCYSNFWTTTLPYESLSICGRMMLFENTKKELGIIPSGILSGLVAQTLTSPLYVKSLKGQMGSKLGTETNLKPSLSLIGRGGVLGFLHLSVM